MKWFDPPKTLDAIKKRAQIILLCCNVLLACANLLIVSDKLDRLGQKMVLYCQTVNFIETICAEQ